MLKGILRSVFRAITTLQQWVEEESINESKASKSNPKITLQNELVGGGVSRKQYKIVNLWDYLLFKEGTQAHHIIKVLDYEEWIGMEEILRRVNELFGVAYQNERSLYPYLKTLVDSGLLEVNMVGGKMRWRKRNLIISVTDEEIIEKPRTDPLSSQSTQ
jgi:hypothetical protein